MIEATASRSLPAKRGAPGQPPPPLSDLEPVEQDTWCEITARLPPDWFTAEQKSLLKELCRHVHYADELARDGDRIPKRPT